MKLKLYKIINYLIKLLYIGSGLVVVVLGIASLFLPILPGFVLIFVGLSIMSRGTKRFDRLKEYFSLSNFLYIFNNLIRRRRFSADNKEMPALAQK